MADSADDARVRRLILMGVASWGLYIVVAILSRRFEIDVPAAERPQLVFLSLFALLFAGYLASLRAATRISDARRVMWWTLAFSAAFRLTLLGSTPIQEIDLYRYVWDGNVLANGVSPYRYSPRDVIRSGDERVSNAGGRRSDLQRLVELQRRSPALGDILRKVHFAELRTLYPPVSQAVFAAAALSTPDGAARRTHLIVMKGWIVLFDLLAILSMIALLKRARLPIGWCLAYAWCPLVLKEFANSGHLDAIAVGLTTAGCMQMTAAAGSRTWPLISSAALLGLAVGAKLYPVLLLPICVAWLARRRGWGAAAAFAVIAGGTAGGTLWPMFRQEVAVVAAITPQPDVQEQPPSTRRFPTQSDSGLTAFLTGWQMNDLLFRIVFENLDPSQPMSRQPWFAVVPDAQRMRLVSPVMRTCDVNGSAAAFLLARGLTLLAFSVVAIVLTWRVLRTHSKPRRFEEAGSDPGEFLEAVFLTLAWFWLLAPTQNPWYWTWCLPLIPFARSRVWLWVSGVTMISYVRFWLGAHWPHAPGPWGSSQSGTSFFDDIVVWIEFGPLLAALFIDRLLRCRGQQ